MPKRAYPTLITWTDPTGKTHVPPDPPLNQGYPPWFPRPNEYRRKVPLKNCPALICRRARRCESLLYGEFCRKPHMEREDFRAALAAKIARFMRANNIPLCENPNNDPPPPEMKRALEARQAECEREELLKFQTGWIEKQKAKWASRPPSPFGTSPNKLGKGDAARPPSALLGEVAEGRRGAFGGLPQKPAVNPVEFRPTLTTR